MCEWEKYNAVRLAIPYIIGMAVAHFLCLHFSLPAWPFAVAVCACAVLVVCGRRQLTYSLAFMAMCFLVGFLLFMQATKGVERRCPTRGQPFKGVVTAEPQSRMLSIGVMLRDGDVRVYAFLPKGTLASTLHEGDSVWLARPWMTPTSPRLHDGSAFARYSDYLFYHSFSAIAHVNKGEWTVVPAENTSGLSFGELRRRALRLYARMGIEGEGGAIVEAMTLGEKSHLTRGQRKAFASAGLSHLLALSGFHLTILITLFNLFLFRSYLPFGIRRALSVLVIPALWAFAALTGFSPSLVRAVVMCTVLQVAFLLGREYSMLNALAVAAVAMLAANPLTLLDVGFQLSFVSMLAIGLLALPTLRRFPSRHGMVVSGLYATLVVSLSCSLFTLPLVAYYFGQVPLLSVLSNVVAAVLATCLMWVSAVWWLLAFWPFAQIWVGKLAVGLAEGLQTVASVFGALPAATLDLRFSLGEVALLYVGLAAYLLHLRSRTARPLLVALSAVVAAELIQLFLR